MDGGWGRTIKKGCTSIMVEKKVKRVALVVCTNTAIAQQRVFDVPVKYLFSPPLDCIGGRKTEKNT